MYKIKTLRKISLWFLIALALSVFVYAQDGCCCNPVTRSGRITNESFCLALNYDFIPELPPIGKDCNYVCDIRLIPHRIPLCGDGICEGDEPQSCPEDCVAPKFLLCGTPGYEPEPTDLVVAPIKGRKAFKISFKQSCPAISFTIRRSEGTSNTAVTVARTTSTAFMDEDSDLKWNTQYVYRVKAYYITGDSEEVAYQVTSGDIECWDKDYSSFCVNENLYSQPKFKDYLQTAGYGTKYSIDFLSDFDESVEDVFDSKINNAYYCDDENELTLRRSCSDQEACALRNDLPVCIKTGPCDNEGPFGLFTNLDSCEKDANQAKFCFFDLSTSIVDACYDCAAIECYDYKSQQACERDNCGIDSCEWHDIIEDLGVGVCVDTKKSNCHFCSEPGSMNAPNKDAWNVVFNNCSENKAIALSIPGDQCFYDRDYMTVKTCDVVTCRDFTEEQCGSILGGISLANDNSILIKSVDACNIGVCQWDEPETVCRKNADGSTSIAWQDCPLEDYEFCEADYLPPITSVIPTGNASQNNFLNFVILDQKFQLDSVSDYAGEEDYETFICLKSGTNSCLNAKNYPFQVSAKRLILKNLDLKDGTSVITRLSEGNNNLFFYSKDPSSNLETIKNITFEACDNCQGPTLLDVKISGGQLVGSNIYSSFIDPVITLYFDEPTKIGSALLTNTPARLIYDSGYKLIHNIRFDDVLPEGVVMRLTLDVENEKHIFAHPKILLNLIIDTSLGYVSITPGDGDVLTSNDFGIELGFNKIVTLEKVLLTRITPKNEYLLEENSSDITSDFQLSGNLGFVTYFFEHPFGAYKIYVEAKDQNGLLIAKESRFFIQNGFVPYINLLEPKFGVSSKQTFKAVVETALKSECKYVFDAPAMPSSASFSSFPPMSSSRGYTHKTLFVSIPLGDTSEHPLYVFCKSDGDIISEEFAIRFDPYAPKLIRAYAFPDIIAEESLFGAGTYSTTLKIETNKKSFCKYSKTTKEFGLMEHVFEGYGTLPKISHFETIVVDSIKSYTYYVACASPAGVVSSTKEVKFSVDLSQLLKAHMVSKSIFDDLEFSIGIETNKRALCYIQNGSNWICTDTCTAEYVHKVDMQETEEGKYKYLIKCVHPVTGQSDTLRPVIILDQTPPEMLYVNDSTTLENPELSYYRNKLRIAFLGNDSLSGISEYLITVVKALTEDIVANRLSTDSDGSYHYIENLTLADNTTYEVVVNAVDNAGLISDPMSSDGVFVNFSAEPYTCNNNVKDGDETDVDCGGSCPSCDDDKACNVNIDCISSLCLNSVCTAQDATCENGVTDGMETDVDCGGPCSPCINGEDCYEDSDCESDYCDISSGTCHAEPDCNDGKLSSGETDVDCGGPCMPCGENKGCEVDVDCAAGLVCDDRVCVVESTLDSDQDGVPNNDDFCPNTPLGETVDEYGCSAAQRMLEEEAEPEKGFNFLLFFLILLLIAGAGVGGYLLYKKMKETRPSLRPRSAFTHRAVRERPKPRVHVPHVPKPRKLSPEEEKIAKLHKFAKKKDLEKGWVELKKKPKKDALEKLKKRVGKKNSEDVFHKLRKTAKKKKK